MIINVNLCWLNSQVFDLAPYDYPVGPSLQQQTSKQQAAVSAVLYMIWLTRRNAANPWIIDLTRNNTAVMGRKHRLPIGKPAITVMVNSMLSLLLGVIPMFGRNFKDT